MYFFLEKQAAALLLEFQRERVKIQEKIYFWKQRTYYEISAIDLKEEYRN